MCNEGLSFESHGATENADSGELLIPVARRCISSPSNGSLAINAVRGPGLRPAPRAQLGGLWSAYLGRTPGTYPRPAAQTGRSGSRAARRPVLQPLWAGSGCVESGGLLEKQGAGDLRVADMS